MTYLVIAAVLGCIPAMIASKKGHSAGAWWIFGTLLFIIALPASFFIKDRHAEAKKFAEQSEKWKAEQAEIAKQNTERECPFCAEPIKRRATKCKHCGSEVEPLPEMEPNPEALTEAERESRRAHIKRHGYDTPSWDQKPKYLK